jgi:hypothetical protein
VRGEVAFGQLLAQIEHPVEGFAGMLGEPGPRRQLVDPKPFVEQEIEVTPGQDGRLHRMVLTPPSTGITAPVM